MPFSFGKILLNSNTIPGDLRLILQRENIVSHHVLISDIEFVHHLLRLKRSLVTVLHLWPDASNKFHFAKFFFRLRLSQLFRILFSIMILYKLQTIYFKPFVIEERWFHSSLLISFLQWYQLCFVNHGTCNRQKRQSNGDDNGDKRNVKLMCILMKCRFLEKRIFAKYSQMSFYCHHQHCNHIKCCVCFCICIPKSRVTYQKLFKSEGTKSEKDFVLSF